MSTIIYSVENTNEQEIKQYTKNNTNLPELNFNDYDEDKPCLSQIDAGTGLVINEEPEDPKVKSNTLEKAINECDEIIIPVKSVSIPEIQNLLAEDLAVHLPRVGIKITRQSNFTNEILDGLAPYTDDQVLRRHEGGRAPVGTNIEDGFLIESDDYDTVRETLTRYVEGEISKEEAADYLNTTPRTVGRASERDELYRLQ